MRRSLIRINAQYMSKHATRLPLVVFTRRWTTSYCAYEIVDLGIQ
jgi:hypothetical protein